MAKGMTFVALSLFVALTACTYSGSPAVETVMLLIDGGKAGHCVFGTTAFNTSRCTFR